MIACPSSLISSQLKAAGSRLRPSSRAGGMTAPCWMCQALCHSCPLGTVGATERWRCLHSGLPPGSRTFWGPWCGLPAHPSKTKHCLNSQHPSLRDRSPGPAEFCPSSHGSGCLPSGPGPSLRCVWPPLLTAPARAHPSSCYRQCLPPNFHQSSRQKLSSRSTCGHGGDPAGYSVHPD